MDEPEAQAHLALAQDIDRPDKQQIIEDAFNAMEAGNSLDAIALAHGIAPATLWRWCNATSELRDRYDCVKIVRSKALIEHALYEMQSARTLEEAKMAERRCNLYLRLAAKLNPKEFSDRMHGQIGKQGGLARNVSFTLNFQGGAQDKGALTVIAQPEDGEE